MTYLLSTLGALYLAAIIATFGILTVAGEPLGTRLILSIIWPVTLAAWLWGRV